MLGGDGEARRRVLTFPEAQWWEDHSNAAVHYIFCLFYFHSTSRGIEEEEKEEQGKQKEEVRGSPCLSLTPGGWKRSSPKQADEATCCCFRKCFCFSRHQVKKAFQVRPMQLLIGLQAWSESTHWESTQGTWGTLGDSCQDNSDSADHSKATTYDKEDIKNDKTRHNCWFDKCSKLSSFKSLSELNSHVRDIHE